GLPSLECAAGLAALAAIGMHNLADYTWYVPAVGLTLAAVAGLALAAARTDAPPPAGRRPCRVGVVLLIVATAAAGWGLRAQMLQAEGQAMLSRGRYQTAAAPLRHAAGLDPLDAGILDDLAQAVSASPLDGPQRAVPIRLQAAALNPLDAGNYLALAQLYATLGEEQSAIAAARRAVEVHPNFARAYVVLAQLQEAIGAEDEALETWRALEDVYESPVGQYQAIEDPVDISWAYAWYALGREAERQGDDDDAAQYYRRAAELTERFARSRRNNEEILREIGSWDEAEVVEAERLERQAERRLERMKERDGQ
ncbi:MAG: tetratricopeptide repeat protein, partial [Armatimonadota bacterium]